MKNKEVKNSSPKMSRSSRRIDNACKNFKITKDTILKSARFKKKSKVTSSTLQKRQFS